MHMHAATPRILPVQADMRENSCPRPQHLRAAVFPVLPVQSATSENSCQQPFQEHVHAGMCLSLHDLERCRRVANTLSNVAACRQSSGLPFQPQTTQECMIIAARGPHQSNDSQQAFESECAGICTGQKLLASSVVHLYEANLLGSLCDQCLRLAAGLLLTIAGIRQACWTTFSNPDPCRPFLQRK